MSYDFESKNSYNWLLLDVKMERASINVKVLTKASGIMCPNGCL